MGKQSWRDGAEFKSTIYFCRWPGLYSQHLGGKLQNIQHPLLTFMGTVHTCGTHTYMLAMHSSHKIILKLLYIYVHNIYVYVCAQQTNRRVKGYFDQIYIFWAFSISTLHARNVIYIQCRSISFKIHFQRSVGFSSAFSPHLLKSLSLFSRAKICFQISASCPWNETKFVQ